MTGFDWPGLMRAGLTGMRLRPDEFWALTPAELRVLLGEGGAARGLGRTGLDALMRAYPDQGDHDDGSADAGRADRPA